MKLSKEAIIDFQKIWREKFSQDLTQEKAQEISFKFLLLFRIIYSSIPPQDENEK